MRRSDRGSWPVKICLILSISLSLVMLVVHSGCSGGGACLIEEPGDEARSLVIARFSAVFDGRILHPAVEDSRLKVRLHRIGSPRSMTVKTDEKGYMFALLLPGDYELQAVSFRDPKEGERHQCDANWRVSVPQDAALYLGSYELFATGSSIDVIRSEPDDARREKGMGQAVQWGVEKHGPSVFNGKAPTSEASLLPPAIELSMRGAKAEQEMLSDYLGWEALQELTTASHGMQEYLVSEEELKPEAFEFEIKH